MCFLPVLYIFTMVVMKKKRNSEEVHVIDTAEMTEVHSASFESMQKRQYQPSPGT